VTAKKLVMFDFDGVIADSWCGQVPVFVETLQAHGLHDRATSAVFRDLMDSNWFEGLARAGLPDHVVSEMEEAWAELTPELFSGMPEVIERLAGDHVVLVITSSATSDVRRALEASGVRGVADVMGGDIESSKTLKTRAARRRYGGSLEPWYVCDTVGDVVEAKAAGATVVGAAWGWHGEERLLRSRPEWIARRQFDLLDLLQE